MTSVAAASTGRRANQFFLLVSVCFTSKHLKPRDLQRICEKKIGYLAISFPHSPVHQPDKSLEFSARAPAAPEMRRAVHSDTNMPLSSNCLIGDSRARVQALPAMSW